MAKRCRLTDVAANTALDALTDLLDGGFLEVYDGTQPATANTAITTQQRLATLAFGAPAFHLAMGGVAAAQAIAPDLAIAQSGDASWARCVQADGVTAVLDLSVDTVDADILVDDIALEAGGEFHLPSLVLTLPEAA